MLSLSLSQYLEVWEVSPQPLYQRVDIDLIALGHRLQRDSLSLVDNPIAKRPRRVRVVEIIIAIIQQNTYSRVKRITLLQLPRSEKSLSSAVQVLRDVFVDARHVPLIAAMRFQDVDERTVDRAAVAGDQCVQLSVEVPHWRSAIAACE